VNQPLEPAIIVIFGITGDLSQRYLLPAIYQLMKDERLPKQTQIFGISRRDVGTEELLSQFEKSVKASGQDCDAAVLAALGAQASMFKMDLDDPAAYDALLTKLNNLEERVGVCLNRLYYLSIPPQAYNSVAQLLGERGLNASCQHDKAATRLLVEKPFGYDLNSAEKLIAETARHFTEEQVYRIDHYMAKPAVLELLSARLNDEKLEEIWNAEHLESVEIAAKETIGIESRTFYDQIGALRDFVQSHLMQILGIVVMDRPKSLDSQELHARKEQGLNQIEPVPADKVGEQTVRGQYQGYRIEVNNPDSTTETYTAVTVYSQNPRWQGTAFKLITGKALNERTTLISGKLKDKTELKWSSQGGNTYDRVLLDAISGDRTLFASSQEILASWRILQPVLDTWQRSANDLIIYEAGSAGPQ
jgi:glucose-6-phosphate 1-dehydrogenase